jgi:uncharacterized protein YeeX (DUF496 family)
MNTNLLITISLIVIVFIYYNKNTDNFVALSPVTPNPEDEKIKQFLKNIINIGDVNLLKSIYIYLNYFDDKSNMGWFHDIKYDSKISNLEKIMNPIIANNTFRLTDAQYLKTVKDNMEEILKLNNNLDYNKLPAIQKPLFDAIKYIKNDYYSTANNKIIQKNTVAYTYWELDYWVLSVIYSYLKSFILKNEKINNIKVVADNYYTSPLKMDPTKTGEYYGNISYRIKMEL